MSYYSWKPYVPVAARQRMAEKEAAKAKKSGVNFSGIEPHRGTTAKTFWGKAWCDNLEAYSDYANRLPRGRTYVRNGSVIHLSIAHGEVQARVMGSSLYTVTVKVGPVAAPHWQAIGKDCSGSIDSLVELLQGKLSTAVMQRICTPQTGLFPAPSEMRFTCSCPDWADMCKHVAAVLYGVGARLDQQPELLFSLRGVDAQDLVSQAGAGLPKSRSGIAADKVLDDAMLGDVFGFEMDQAAPPIDRVVAKTKAVAVKTGAKSNAQAVVNKPAPRAAKKVTKKIAETVARRVTRKVARKVASKVQSNVPTKVPTKATEVVAEKPAKAKDKAIASGKNTAEPSANPAVNRKVAKSKTPPVATRQVATRKAVIAKAPVTPKKVTSPKPPAKRAAVSKQSTPDKSPDTTPKVVNQRSGKKGRVDRRVVVM